MKTVAILQARVSSSRLPGKVMLPLLGKPMIARQLERIRRATRIHELVLATSSDPGDDAIAELCEREGLPCFRGSLDDVLDRIYRAAAAHSADVAVRLTGDCPLSDPGVIDATIDFYSRGDFDYASNAIEPTFPDGLDVEVVRFAALEQAWRDARSAAEREHVTLFLYRNPGRFRVGCLRNATDLSALRWTVDQPQDFEFVRLVYESLYPGKPEFRMDDVLAFLATHPEAAALNRGINRNEGLARSLQKEAQLKG